MNSLSVILSELANTPYIVAIVASSYLLGAIPSGYLIAKLFLGYDIRTRGSGNIGMTNMIRTGGKIPGIATFLLDFLKGTAGVFIARLLNAPDSAMLLAGFLGIFGHTRSIFLSFRGGKGMATCFGVLMAIDYILFSIVAACWLVVFSWKRISSLAALSALGVLPLSAFLLYGAHMTFFFCITAATYIFALHRENIERLLTNRENELKSSKKPE